MRKTVVTILVVLTLLVAGALPVIAQELGSPNGPPTEGVAPTEDETEPGEVEVSPTEDVAPTENVPPVEDVQPAEDAQEAAVEGVEGAQLAQTGFDTATAALIAVGLLLIGGLALVVSRRRARATK